MARFYLLKDRPLYLDSNSFAVSAGPKLIFKREVTFPAVLECAETSESGGARDDGDDFCTGLMALLEDGGIGNHGSKLAHPAAEGQHKEPLDWNLKITIGVDPDGLFLDKNRNYIQVAGADKGNLLAKLKAVLEPHYGKMVGFIVEIKNLKCDAPNSYVSSVTTKEVTMDKLSSKVPGREGTPLDFSGSFNKVHWYHCNAGKRYTYTGTISITVILPSSFSSLEDLLYEATFFRGTIDDLNRKILEENIECDAKITACDGTVKCHKAFLSVQSPVLQAMFKDAYKDSKTSTVEMLEMTSEAVKAFLGYLYYKGVKKADENSRIVLNLFKAGHKYNVQDLQIRMKDILLSKPDKWFEVDVAMMMYLFAKNLDKGEPLLKRAVKLLKMNSATLKSSPSCKELFEKDPMGALELYMDSCTN